MNILVTGGAGYIGRITADLLKKNGLHPVIYDLKNGQDISDTAKLTDILKQKKIQAVIHFAAFIEMGESMFNPIKYFNNNFLGTQSLLEAMIKAKVKKIIFSSTAGVYGNPKRLPLKETDAVLPENPYGQSKLMVEQLLDFYSRAGVLRSISLRYFNAAGASLDGKSGEDHQPESHLIPNAMTAILHNKPLTLFGNDYLTKDGTCVRDYIHVLDLARAHLLALKALMAGHKTAIYNAGTGKGYSNLAVIKMIEAISGKKVKIKFKSRRPGDATELVADPAKFQQEFSWKPQYSDLKTIVKTAWLWHQNRATI
jgi:UDP-glucose 4-epimerase